MRTGWLLIVALLICVGCAGGGTAPDGDLGAQIDGLFQRRIAFLNGQRLGDTDYQLEMSVAVQDDATQVTWNFGGGATPNTSNSSTVVIRLGMAGNYSGHVVMRNAQGQSQRKFRYRVAPLTEPLITSVSPERYAGLIGIPVQFSCVLSQPALNISWTIDDEPGPAGPHATTAEATFSKRGHFPVRLEVDSTEGDREIREWEVEANESVWEPIGGTSRFSARTQISSRQLSDGRGAVLYPTFMRIFPPERDRIGSGVINNRPITMPANIDFKIADIALIDGEFTLAVATGGGVEFGDGIWIGHTAEPEPNADTDWDWYRVSYPDAYWSVRLLKLPNEGLLLIASGQSRQRISVAWAGHPDGPEDWTDINVPFASTLHAPASSMDAAIIDEMLVQAGRTETDARVVIAPLATLDEFATWSEFVLPGGVSETSNLTFDGQVAATQDALAVLTYSADGQPRLYLSPDRLPGVRSRWGDGIDFGLPGADMRSALAVGLTETRVIAVVPGSRVGGTSPNGTENAMEVWSFPRVDLNEGRSLGEVRFKPWAPALVIPVDTVTVVGHDNLSESVSGHSFTWLLAPEDV